MGKTVAVVDYGMGNLRSVSQAVAHVARHENVRVIVTANPEEVYTADRVVFANAEDIRALGMKDGDRPPFPFPGAWLGRGTSTLARTSACGDVTTGAGTGGAAAADGANSGP